MSDHAKPKDCRMSDDQWAVYCKRMSKPSHKDWCRICGEEVSDHEYMRYGFKDQRCRRCR